MNAPAGSTPTPTASDSSEATRWAELLAIMRAALTDEQRREFDRHASARRVERDQAIARAGALGWAAGRTALGRDIAAARAAKLAGQPRPAPTLPPEFVLLGRAIDSNPSSPANDPPAPMPPALLDLSTPPAAKSTAVLFDLGATSGRPTSGTATTSQTTPPAATPSNSCSCSCSCSSSASSAATPPAAATPSNSSSASSAATPSSPPPIRLRTTPRDRTGSFRLGRVSMPGTTRERCIVQLPTDDARDRAGNSLVYGFGLRTLMGVGAATRRAALGAIVTGLVNPHDPVDVFRWSLVRRMPAGAHTGELLALVDTLALAARATRARVSMYGIDIGAEQLRTREGVDESISRSSPNWSGVAAAIDTLEQLAGQDRAELAGLLASDDLDVARAWAQENLMSAEQ